MKRLTCTICSTIVLSMVFAGSSTHAQAQRPSSTTAYLDRLHAEGKERVIVRFERSPNAALVEKHAGRVIREIKLLHALIAEVPMTNIQSLQSERGVLAVFPDAIISVGPEYAVPFDELSAGRQTDSGTQTAPTGPARGKRAPSDYPGPVTVEWNNLEAGLNSKAAWDRYDLDGAGIKIAFLDTGINYTMENLDTNYLGGYDFVNNDSDPINSPDRDGDGYIIEWHGTAVASMAVGEGVNMVVGVAYGASYYALKILDANAIGLVSNAIAAIQWCLDPDGNPTTTNDRPDIINMSFGAYPAGPEKDALEIACNAAYNAGITLVAGSGNDGYTYSMWPASFNNVISVGGHAEDQTRFDYSGYSSNGGVDIVAPGARVATVDPDNLSWWAWGTSLASPHAAGLIALQLQYARQNNIEVNNGYFWEVMKHSAKDMPLIPDPNYKGKGKIWAAESAPPPPTPHDGSIDCMAASWPISFTLGFMDYAYITGDGLPAYVTGTPMVQNLGLHNVTDTVGSSVEDIVNLTATTRQAYYGREGGAELPGASVEVVGGQAVIAGGELTLPDSYDIPMEVVPGVNQTAVEFGFQFAGNDRYLEAGYRNTEGLWVAASEPNIPTVSDWGAVALTLVILTAGTLVLIRRRCLS